LSLPPIALSITFPAFNEEGTLAEVAGEAIDSGARLGVPFEVLIVNDGSTDATAETAERLAAEDERIRVVHHSTNRGFSGAMQSCVSTARGDYVFLGPADGQADYGDLSRFWGLKPKYDLIFSYRAGRGDRFHRKAGSFVWYSLLRLLFGERIPEFSSTFLFNRRQAMALPVDVRPDASNFLPVLYLRAKQAGLRVGTLGTIQAERRQGEPKGSNVPNALRTIREDFRIRRQWRSARKRRESG
jgi:glycosyltransferase involved in cell wall biosynthesis